MEKTHCLHYKTFLFLFQFFFFVNSVCLLLNFTTKKDYLKKIKFQLTWAAKKVSLFWLQERRALRKLFRATFLTVLINVSIFYAKSVEILFYFTFLHKLWCFRDYSTTRRYLRMTPLQSRWMMYQCSEVIFVGVSMVEII